MKKVQNFNETIKIPLHYWKTKDYYLYITLPNIPKELNVDWCDHVEYLVCDNMRLLDSQLDLINESYSIWIFSFNELELKPVNAYNNLITKTKNENNEINIKFDLNGILNIDEYLKKYDNSINFFIELEFPKIEKILYSTKSTESTNSTDSKGISIDPEIIEFFIETN